MYITALTTGQVKQHTSLHHSLNIYNIFK